MLRNKIERLEKELRARGNGGEPVDLATWATHKRAICERLGIDPDGIADDVQGAHAAGFSCVGGQVAAALGLSLRDFLAALQAKAHGGGLS